MVDAMSPKERWLAALHLEPVDRLPFWPKINRAYAQAQGERYASMPLEQLHEWIGSDQHVGLPACLRETRQSTSSETTRQADRRTTVYRTPIGEAWSVEGYDAVSQAWHPLVFPVKTRDDIPVMIEFYADLGLEVDPDALRAASARAREVGESAVTCTSIGKSALMHWVELLAGVETAHYLLHDIPELVTRLFDTLHGVLARRTELLAERHPADLLYMVENTSTTLISPAQYRRYCRPHLAEYARICRQAGRLLALHMCGHLKALLPDVSTLPVAAFEAFTSPTLGDTTLLDGRAQCPDKCLIGGTNAMLWLQPEVALYERIAADLDVLPHHRGVVLSSAGVMPPLCPPERIRGVRARLAQYALRQN